MIPLVHMTGLDENASVYEAVKVIKDTGHSRIPIYSERIDNITGVLHSFFILGAEPSDKIKKYAQPPYFVPDSKKVDELMDEMKRGKGGMAIVVDE